MAIRETAKPNPSNRTVSILLMIASNLKKDLPFLFAILLIIIIFAYANSLRSPFLFDDVKIENNLEIRNLDKYTQIANLQYRHAHFATLALNYQLGGLNPFSYHIFNLILHSCTTLLVFLVSFLTAEKGLMMRRQAAIRSAFVAALLFALNPALSEAVTYISGRPSSLATVFYMLSLHLFILASLNNPALALPRQLTYFLSTAIFIASVMTKEIALTWPLVIVLYDICFMRTEHWVTWKTRLFGFYLLIPGMVIIFTLKSTASVSIFNWWLGKIDYTYALAQIKVINHAFSLFYFPINLTSEYSSYYYFDAKEPAFILCAIFWFCILLVAVKVMLKSPVLLFSILWFLITISPTNSIIPREDLFSERNLYLPSFGLVFLFSITFDFMFKASFERNHELLHQTSLNSTIVFRPYITIACTFGLMVILTANSALLIKRNFVYKSSLGYWEDAYKKIPQKMRVLHNLSLEYLKKGHSERALVILNKMLEVNPNNYFAKVNRVKIYIDRGDLSFAENEYEELIRTNPGMLEPYFNLGSLHAMRGNYEKAREFYDKAETTAEAQQHPELFLHRGKIYFKLGLIGQARGDLERFFSILNEAKGGIADLDNIHNLLGLIYIEQSEPLKAIIEFEKAVALNPRLFEAHFNLGNLLLANKIDFKKSAYHFVEALSLIDDPQKKMQVLHGMSQISFEEKQHEQALDILGKILEINPTDYYAHFNRLKIFIERGDLSSADKEFKDLIRTHPETFELYSSMGDSHAIRGNFEKASEFYEKAETTPEAQQLHELVLHRGKTYYHLGYKKLAKIVLERYLSMQKGSKIDLPEQDTVHNLLGLIYVDQNNPQKAIKEFEASIKSNPRFFDAHFNLGKLLFNKKIDIEKASYHLGKVLSLTADPKRKELAREMMEQIAVDTNH